jgi:predicted alpha/beta hydrolase family esterase
MAYVLVNHGWTNTRQKGHWQRTLAADLRNAGHQVFYPQYPNTQQPSFAEWSALLQAELELLLETRAAASVEAATAEVIVIGHSLGCVNFIKTALQGNLSGQVLGQESAGPLVDRVLFVAPPGPEKIDTLPDFAVVASAPEISAALNAVAGSVTLVGSDNDPWSPRGIQATYGDPLGLQVVVIPGAKHLASSDGWSSWQGVFNWVNDPRSDLTVR